LVTTEIETTPAGGQIDFLKYLPSQYSESEFMGRFLKIFESISGPLEGMIDNLAFYLDPNYAPEELLPWLATWMRVGLDEKWPLERRRELVKSAGTLFRWRGTRRGLREYLRICTGVEPQIVEDFGGIRLGPGSKLGRNTVLGGGNPHTFTVTFEVEDPASVNVDQVKAIIESEKPAHVAYTLAIVGK